MPSRLDIPVVFLVFNRPEPTARVFARIRDARPAKLFVVADGPRPDHIGDAEKCRRVRELIAEGIDWPCEVVRDYAEKNLGSGRRVASGITKAFEAVEEASKMTACRTHHFSRSAPSSWPGTATNRGWV